MLTTASVKMFTPPAAKPALTPGVSSISHFGTAGRILAFFPNINKNGYTFLAEDITDAMVSTLVGSTVDLEHVKKGFGVTSMLVPRETNTVCGSIVQAVKNEHGIDIATKLERSVITSFGFSTADFEPGAGILASYSQEMDFHPNDGNYVVVDKIDASKILQKIPYADGIALGFPDVTSVGPSRMVAGKWEYTMLDGNPVYFAPVPISFVGVGHVARPADASALTYKLVASEGATSLVAWYPGMDDGAAAPHDMVGLSDYMGNDMNVYASDFVTHPDVMSASADNYNHLAESLDKKNKDDSFAVNYCCSNFDSVTNGKPNIDSKRMFRIKNDKGELDRNRLISAYRALAGFRGATHLTDGLPDKVKAHAMAVVRQGLKSTKPKISKENSSHMELDELNAKIAAHIEANKLVSSADHNKVVSEVSTLTASVTALTATVADKDAEIATLKASLETANTEIGTFKATALASARLAELEAVHPFTADEKADAEKFGQYVTSLASLSEDGLENALLKREVAKMKASAEAAPARLVASLRNAPLVNPVPAVGATTEESFGLGDY